MRNLFTMILLIQMLMLGCKNNKLPAAARGVTHEANNPSSGTDTSTLGTDTSTNTEGTNAGTTNTQSGTNSSVVDNTPPQSVTLTGTPNATTNVSPLSVNVVGPDVTEYQYDLRTDSSCANASFGTWTSVSTPIANSLTENNYILCVQGRDAAGNVQTSITSYAFVYDSLPPTATLSGAPSALSNNQKLTVTVSGDGVVSYQYALTTQGTACDAVTYNGTWVPVSTQITDAVGADGNRSLCVIGKDVAGNIQSEENATQHNWTQDATPPANATLSGEPAASSNVSPLAVTVNGADVVDYRYELRTDASCTNPSYSSWRALATQITDSLSNNDYVLCVEGRDAAGNIQTSVTSYAFEYDITLPTVTLDGTPSAASNSTNLAVTVEGDDVISYQYSLTTQSVDCASASYGGTWLSVATQITDAIGADGNKRLCVIGRDAAGNAQTVANATVYNWVQDTVAPVATLSNLPGAATTPLNITVDGDDLVDYQFSLTTSSTSCADVTYNGSWIPKATAITSTPAAGDNRLCVKGRDAAGNVQAQWDGNGAASFGGVGSDESLSVADNSSLDPANTETSFSYSFWFKVNSVSGSQQFIGKILGSDGNREYQIRLVNSEIKAYLNSNGLLSGANELTATNVGNIVPGQWYHVVFWHDGTNDELGIRVNDTLQDVKPHVGGVHNSSQTLYFGAIGTLYELDGEMSKIGFWKNHILTSAEVTELYNLGNGKRYSNLSTGVKTNLISYWDLDEASGTREDSHGSNHLTDNNTVTQGTGPGESTTFDWIHDTTAPTFTAFELQDTTSNSTTVSNSNTVKAVFTASDNDTLYYCASTTLTSQPSKFDSCWTQTQPINITVTSGQTVYGWVRDAAGNPAASGMTDSITVSNPCTGGGSMDGATCTVNTDLGILPNGDTSFSGTANIVIASGGTFSTNPKEAVVINTTGNFTVNSGVTVNANISSLTANNVTIEGTLSANGLGEQGVADANGPGTGGGLVGIANGGAGGGAYGGVGGKGEDGIAGGNPYGSISSPVDYGSAGGGSYLTKGGHGGGLIKIVASGSITVNGILSANGAHGQTGSFGASRAGGGGSGGSLWLSGTLVGTGTISAIGGNGGNEVDADGGGGSGGRISTNTSSAFPGTFSIAGGNGTGTGYSHNGHNGTLYFSDLNGWCSSASTWATGCVVSTVLPFGNGQSFTSTGNLIVANGGAIQTSVKDFLSFNITGNVTIQSGGSILANISNMNVTNLTVDSGATFSANSMGEQGVHLANGVGAGAGTVGAANAGAGGGGHGGAGGNGETGIAGGSTYGSISEPVTFGSTGGGSYLSKGGHGGGAIKVTASNTITVNGTLSATGGVGEIETYGAMRAAGGGAGGSLWLSGSLAGNGVISAAGGAGGSQVDADGGGGGGGRISIVTSSNSFSGTLTAAGGNATDGATSGESGTIFLQDSSICTGGGSLSGTGINACKVNSTLPTYSAGSIIGGTGDLVIQSNGVIASNAVEKISIQMGGNVTIESGGAINANLSNLSATNLTIDSNGVINVTGLGFAGGASGVNGSGPGGGTGTANQDNGGGGAGHGGNGGVGRNGMAGGPAYGSATAPATFGSGGGGGSGGAIGGNGGGAVKVTLSGTLTLNGAINAKGTMGGTGGARTAAGGAGGSIWLIANSFSGNGTIDASGGNGGVPSYDSGGGAGGRIRLEASNSPFHGTINYDGGLPTGYNANPGERGTLSTEYSNPCDSGDLSSTCTINSTITIGEGTAFNSSGSVVIANGGKIQNTHPTESISIVVSGDLTIQSGGSIVGNLSNLSAANIHLAAGGSIDADSLGYRGGDQTKTGEGPGAGTGTANQSNGGGAGGHGGAGGNGYNAVAGGGSYGSNTAPVSYGSGGGGAISGAKGGHGGGAIKVTASGALTIEGTISARGSNAIAGSDRGSGAGAGGSIWIIANAISGNGSILANGGNAVTAGVGYGGGGGGGGRIALQYSSGAFLGTKNVAGGQKGPGIATDGAQGTVCINGTGLLCHAQLKENLVLWLSADQGITKDPSDVLTNWYDQSSSNNHVSAITGNPTWQSTNSEIDNRSSIAFTNDKMTLTSPIALAKNYTIITVAKAPSNNVLMGGVSGTSDYSWVYGGAAGIYHKVAGDSNLMSVSNFVNSWSMQEVVREGSDLKLFEKGSLSSSLTYANNADLTLQTIGAYASGGAPLTGGIAEILIFNKALSNSNRQKVEAYLAVKYGINILPTTNQVGWFKADNGLFSSQDCTTTPATNALDEVRCWKDQSPAQNHATKTGASNASLKKASVNSKDAVEYVGETLSFGSQIDLGTAHSVYSVFKPTAEGVILNGSGKYIGYVPSNLSFVDYYTGSFQSVLTPASAIANWSLLSVNRENNYFSQFLNGKEAFSNVATQTSAMQMNSLGASYDGELAEVCLYDAQLSKIDDQRVQTYLSEKYALNNATNPVLDVPGLKLWLSADSQTERQIGGASQFVSANSESLHVPDNATVDTGNIDFTLSAWVYVDNVEGGHKGIVGKWRQQSEYLIMQYNAGAFRFYVNGSSVFVEESNVGNISPNTWYFVVAWHDATNDQIGISVNAGPADVLAHSTGVVSGNSDFHMGHYSNTNFHNGRIARVGFWKNRVLNSASITELYNAGVGRAHSELTTNLRNGLVSYWDLSEDSGTRSDLHGTNHLSDNNTVTGANAPNGLPKGTFVSSWKDQSGQGNHATQSDNTKKPIWIADGGASLNGRPVISFTTGKQLVTQSLSSSLKSMFAVKVRDDGGGSNVWPIYQSGGGSGYFGLISHPSVDSQTRWHDGTTLRAVYYPSFATLGTTPHIYSGTLTSGNYYTHLDGTQSGTQTALGSHLHSGPVSFGASGFNGDFAEIILYDGEVTSDQRKAIECYLGLKYGITITGHICN